MEPFSREIQAMVCIRMLVRHSFGPIAVYSLLAPLPNVLIVPRMMMSNAETMMLA